MTGTSARLLSGHRLPSVAVRTTALRLRSTPIHASFGEPVFAILEAEAGTVGNLDHAVDDADGFDPALVVGVAASLQVDAVGHGGEQLCVVLPAAVGGDADVVCVGQGGHFHDFHDAAGAAGVGLKDVHAALASRSSTACLP